MEFERILWEPIVYGVVPKIVLNWQKDKSYYIRCTRRAQKLTRQECMIIWTQL